MDARNINVRALKFSCKRTFFFRMICLANKYPYLIFDSLICIPPHWSFDVPHFYFKNFSFLSLIICDCLVFSLLIWVTSVLFLFSIASKITSFKKIFKLFDISSINSTLPAKNHTITITNWQLNRGILWTNKNKNLNETVLEKELFLLTFRSTLFKDNLD